MCDTLLTNKDGDIMVIAGISCINGFFLMEKPSRNGVFVPLPCSIAEGCVSYFDPYIKNQAIGMHVQHKYSKI